MWEGLFPDERRAGVCDVDLRGLAARGYRGLILDIDNTLARPGDAKPGEDVARWLESARAEGFRLCVVSNARRRRVRAFCNGLGIPAVCGAGKPSAKGFQKALRLMGVPAERAVAIGDQVFTDVRGAKRLGIHAILTRYITLNEIVFVMVKRPPEMLVLRQYRRAKKYRMDAAEAEADA